MKKVLLVFMLMITILACQQDPKVVDFKVIDYYGLEEVINRNDDKTYVVNFWATWCVPCVKELPYFEKLNQEYQGKNVQVVLVSLDFPNQYESKLRPFINKHQLESELFALDDMNSNYWIPQVNQDWSGAIPATLIFNQDKRQFYEQPFEYEELKTEIQQFIN